MSIQRNLLLAASVAALAMSASVHAQRTSTTAFDYYFGGNLALLDYSESGVVSDSSLTGFYGRLGRNFGNMLSAEARLGFGVSDDSVSALGNRVTLEFENMIGAYARAGVPITEQFYPYVIGGYTRAELSYDPREGRSRESSENDFSFGIGIDYRWQPEWHLNLEYMNYLDKRGVEVEGFSVGIARSF